MSSEYLLNIKDVSKSFRSKGHLVKAVNGISFDLKKGETLALVGESGCGKSTTGRLILRLLESDSGEIWFKDKEISSLKSKELRKVRGSMQMVFQDPYGSLNPRMSVRKLLSEAVESFSKLSKDMVDLECEAIIRSIGLSVDDLDKYPHQFSGGQRQRIGIGRAIATNPELIICDEPVSALDLLVQAQILNLLNDLKREHNFSYIFISHDLSVVKHMSDRIGIMYRGEIVEIGTTDEIFNTPAHPYTKELLSAILTIGESDDLANSSFIENEKNRSESGCIYSGKCSHYCNSCGISKVASRRVSDTHYVRCIK